MAFGRRRQLAVLVLGLLLAPSLSVLGADTPLQVSAYPELARFDAETGAWLEAARADVHASLLSLSMSPLELEAERDEIVSFTLRISGSEKSQPLAWTAGLGPSGKQTSVSLDLYEALSVRVSAPSRGRFIHPLGLGQYPDALVPTSTITPRASPAAATLFVDVFVPATAEPGRHQVSLFVGERHVPIEIDVGREVLPAEDVSGLGAVSFGGFQARLAEDPLAFRRAVQLLYAHRFGVELIPPWRPSTGEDGLPDWESWADRVLPYIDGSAFTADLGYRGPRPGRSVTRFVVPLTEKWPSPPEEGRPKDPAAFTATLRTFERIAEARGFFAEQNRPDYVLFVNDLDEPKSKQEFEALESYRELLEVLSVRRRIVFRIDGPFGSGTEQWPDDEVVRRLAPVMDAVAVCGGPPWIPTDALRTLRDKRPHTHVLLYASNTAGEPTMGPVVLDAPLAGLVAWGWIAARNSLRGVLNWEVDFRPGCFADPLCSGESQNLDATLVYRAEELGGPRGQIYASWRLKALRRGAQDAALLHLLAQKDPTAARRFTELVIPNAIGVGPTDGPGAWPNDPRTWSRVRRQLRARVRGAEGPLELEPLLAQESGAGGGVWRRLLIVLTLFLPAAWLVRRLARRPGI